MRTPQGQLRARVCGIEAGGHVQELHAEASEVPKEQGPGVTEVAREPREVVYKHHLELPPACCPEEFLEAGALQRGAAHGSVGEDGDD